MSWETANSYTAKIGGIIYKNVKLPIVYNDSPMLTVTRHSVNGELGLSFQIYNEKSKHIGNVENNKITFINTNDYVVLNGLKRQSLIDKKSGRVLCDLKFATQITDPELEVSTIIFSKDGYPIILHPNRSKFGKANDNEPPNISHLTLTTQEDSQAGAISLKNRGAIYLLGIAIENFKTGISIEN